jgi:iron complex outermembrane receptor protein
MPVPDRFKPNITRTIGEQESRGYEFEAAGEILPSWNVIGVFTHLSYANINKDVGADGGLGNTGNRMFNAPAITVVYGQPMKYRLAICKA